MKKIYFDNAATTKIDPSVLTTINHVMKENYGNPSSSHSFGRASRTIVEKARKSTAIVKNKEQKIKFLNHLSEGLFLGNKTCQELLNSIAQDLEKVK